VADQDAQVELGLVLLGRARNPEAIASAVGMLGSSADPRIRQVIGQKYDTLNAEPRRRDSGCFQRTALVRALRGRATPDDVGLLETALWTHEIIGRFDAASELRAAALVTLNDVNGSLACFHGVRLLSDAHEMSGEPAVTAARLLAMREHLLPLYGLVANRGGTPEVRAECLRGLTGLPVSLVDRLLEQYRDEKDATVMVGLVDLLLGHPSRAAFAAFTASRLDRAQAIDLYRFVVNSIVASRDPVLIALLRRPDGPGENSPKGTVLREALGLIEPPPQPSPASGGGR
jgi:hypothetical protein